jgi:hypothetical protein
LRLFSPREAFDQLVAVMKPIARLQNAALESEAGRSGNQNQDDQYGSHGLSLSF